MIKISVLVAMQGFYPRLGVFTMSINVLNTIFYSVVLKCILWGTNNVCLLNKEILCLQFVIL